MAQHETTGVPMTDLNKPIHRRTRQPFAHYRKRIIVTLDPGDLLSMRLERTRTRYRAPIAEIFRQLAHWHALAEAKRKREERKARLSV
jgi:hypothetical protein